LLKAGDSTSVVLPIEKKKDTYQISFAARFDFNPEQLVSVVDSVMALSHIVNHYIVEVKSCRNNEVVYSYEKGMVTQKENEVNPNLLDIDTLAILPCQERAYPNDCYTIHFTVLEANTAAANEMSKDDQVSQKSDNTRLYLGLIIVIILAAAGYLIWFTRNKKKSINLENYIAIGSFLFDPVNSVLLHKTDKIELSGKESELLMILQQHANVTVEKEVMLNKVWGDEGDYIGRTLDVFVSKLRKKLEADENIKIMNVRGVGYKLVCN
jgi:hypothetical protein